VLVSAKSQITCCPFGGNWLHIIFRRIVLEAAQIWQELAPHYSPADCFWRQLRFGGNWHQFIFRPIVLEAAQIWRELAQHFFSVYYFWRQLRFGWNWLHIIFRRIVLEAAQIWWELAPHSHYFPVDCFGGSSDLAGTGSTLFSGGLFFKSAQIWRELAPHYFPVGCFLRQLRFGGNWLFFKVVI
jgi:hypothetical protein